MDYILAYFKHDCFTPHQQLIIKRKTFIGCSPIWCAWAGKGPRSAAKSTNKLDLCLKVETPLLISKVHMM